MFLGVFDLFLFFFFFDEVRGVCTAGSRGTCHNVPPASMTLWSRVRVRKRAVRGAPLLLQGVIARGAYRATFGPHGVGGPDPPINHGPVSVFTL